MGRYPENFLAIQTDFLDYAQYAMTVDRTQQARQHVGASIYWNAGSWGLWFPKSRPTFVFSYGNTNIPC